MKAQIRNHAGTLTVEVEGADIKELFRKLSDAQDAFDAATKCGLCNSPYIKFRHRTNDGFDFYELGCIPCGARLQFGQRREGGALFAKRRDENGQPLPAYGWAKYEPTNNKK